MIVRIALPVVVACIVFTLSNAYAMFVRYQTQQVPIDRLFTNLRQRLAQNTNSLALRN